MRIRQENAFVTYLTLDAVDCDGAIRESLDAVRGDTRAGFLAKAGLFGGGALGGTALLGLTAEAASAATAQSDVAILNFALTLEYLEAAFYTEAEQMLDLSGELALFTRVVAAHERAHVSAIKDVLGSKAVKKPKFNFRGTTESEPKFRATAQVLEDTGVRAYKGQAPLIKSNAILEAALAIHAVEARHASWIRDLNDAPPAPTAFDKPLSRSAVLAAVAKTRFIVPKKSTGGRRTTEATSPRFTG
ncbi:MAG: ferritin-like domain-containing protein [Actinobacteria bacterium]|nr:ferritin-like domain-containing protein [Actinomycetota bacterium]